MLDKYEKLVDEFRNTIKDYEKQKTQLAHEVQREKVTNRALRKKIEKVYDNPEINDSELYLINKIEKLEAELWEKDELLRKYKTVDNS